MERHRTSVADDTLRAGRIECVVRGDRPVIVEGNSSELHRASCMRPDQAEAIVRCSPIPASVGTISLAGMPGRRAAARAMSFIDTRPLRMPLLSMTGSRRTLNSFIVASAAWTESSKRNGGVFPKSRVQFYVTGDAPGAEAHGSRDMPVWGPIFRFLDPSDLKVKLRIANIVGYLESIQMK